MIVLKWRWDAILVHQARGTAGYVKWLFKGKEYWVFSLQYLQNIDPVELVLEVADNFCFKSQAWSFSSFSSKVFQHDH